MQEKKKYETPRLIIHGDIQKITLGEGYGELPGHGGFRHHRQDM